MTKVIERKQVGLALGCILGGGEGRPAQLTRDYPQMDDFMRLYSGLVERCFNACAQDFTSKALTTNEVGQRSAGAAELVVGRWVWSCRPNRVHIPTTCSLSRPTDSRCLLLTTAQTNCVQNCADKFLKHSERVGARFAEHNAGGSADSLASTTADTRRTNEAVVVMSIDVQLPLWQRQGADGR